MNAGNVAHFTARASLAEVVASYEYNNYTVQLCTTVRCRFNNAPAVLFNVLYRKYYDD